MHLEACTQWPEVNPTVAGSWSALSVSSDNSAFKNLVVRCRYFASCVDTLNVSEFYMSTP